MSDLRNRLLRVFAGIANERVTGVSGVTASAPPKSASYTGHTGYTPANTTHVTGNAAKVITPAAERDHAAASEGAGAAPAEWAKRIGLLKSGEPRLGMSPLHWSQFVRDARQFLRSGEPKPHAWAGRRRTSSVCIRLRRRRATT